MIDKQDVLNEILALIDEQTGLRRSSEKVIRRQELSNRICKLLEQVTQNGVSKQPNSPALAQTADVGTGADLSGRPASKTI